MKKLDITPITNSAQFFPKKGTLEFLQLCFQEGFTELIKSLIGVSYNASTMYILRGVVDTGTHPTYTTTEGVVFYAGEFYLIDSASFTASGANVAVFSIIQTQYSTDADPCTFSDATTHNIHNIRKMQLTAAASGSALADLSAAYYLNFVIPAQLNLTATGQAVISGGYPNLNVDVPAATNLNPVLTAGSTNLGNTTFTNQDFTITLPITVSTVNYYVMGCFISNGTPADDTTAIFTVRNRSTTAFVINVRRTNNVVSNIAFEYICFAK